MGGGGKTTVGYRYYMGLHMGISYGPVDSVMEIRAGDRTAWSGNVTGNATVNIEADELFGGEEKEGGILGKLDVMMGAQDQTANTYLTAKQGAPQPAYRGILSLVFRGGLSRFLGSVVENSSLAGGLISANNPYVKPWAFRVRRVTADWDGGTVWNSAQAAIDMGNGVTGMNPAHIIYQALTDRSRGKGYNAGRLDLDSFAAAAGTFFTEGLGLCFTWNKPAPIEEFIQEVCDHAGAAVGEDPTTGLIRLKAIRADYDVEDLQVFSRAAGNIIELEGFDRAAVSGGTNELTVSFLEQTTGKPGSVTVQHLASVQALGAVNSAPANYPGCPTALLATRLALRDLNVTTARLARVRMRCNRAAHGLLPGDVIAFSEPKYGIELMPLRIGLVNYGSLRNGEITIEAVQDVFGLPLTTYVSPQPVEWEEPDFTPLPSDFVEAIEAPYRDVARAIGADSAEDLDANAGFLAMMAKLPASVSTNYELHTRTGSNDYALADNGDWCPTGVLTTGIPAAAGPTAISITDGVDLDYVSVGAACLIDNEIFRVTAIDAGAATATLARGCADTVPTVHASGARIWFYQDYAGFDPTEYATGETVDAKVRTRTGQGLLDEASSPGDSVNMQQRLARPYPPGQFRINSTAYPSAVFAGSAVSVSGVHRDRLLQQDQLIDTTEGGIGPEAGTTYTAIARDGTSLVALRTISGLTTPSATFTPTNLGESLTLRFDLYSVRDGLQSRQVHQHLVTRVDEFGNPITSAYFDPGGEDPPPSFEGLLLPHAHDGTNHLGTRKFTASGGGQSVHVWYTANDGGSWTKNNNNIGFDVRRLVFGGGIYAALGAIGWFGRSLSVSGTWSSAAKTNYPVAGITGGLRFYDLIYDGTKFVGVGEHGIIVTSTDGLTWTEVSSNTIQGMGTIKAIAWSGSTYLVSVEDTSTVSGQVIYRLMSSTDLATWTDRTYPTDSENSNGFFFNRIRYTNSRFIAMGSRRVSGNTRAAVLESADGITWTARHPIAGGGVTWGETAADCLYFSGRYVLGGSGFRAYSADLTSWTMDELSGIGAHSFAANATAMFGVKDIDKTGKTTDGITWSDHTV